MADADEELIVEEEDVPDDDYNASFFRDIIELEYVLRIF